MLSRVVRSLSLTLALVLGSAAQADEPDPYAPVAADELSQRLHAAEMGEPGGDQALEAWLAAHRAAEADARRRAYARLCTDYGVRGWGRPRLAACLGKRRLEGQAPGDDDAGMASALAEAPPVRAVGAARVPLIWNAFGSQSAEVVVAGVAAPWFIDTGAEVSVVTQSLAERIGVRRLGEGIRVGTTTADVHGWVGMIDLMTIGDAAVENVPVLVLPDAQLTIGGTHKIEAILGLPVFVAFRRMAWVEGGNVLTLGEAAPHVRVGAEAIYWHDEGLGVPVRTSLGVMGAHLDTGANSTDWRRAGVALLTPEVLATATEALSRVGGAGGVVEVRQRRLPHLEFSLAGQPVSIDQVDITETSKGSAGRVGMDAVSRFGTFILDFETMRIDATPKTAEERTRPGWRRPRPEDFQVGGAPPTATPGEDHGAH